MTLERTPSQTVGPFFAIGLVREGENVVVPTGDVKIVGRVLDGNGDPVPDAVVELWQASDEGTRWGRCGTDADGAFEFVTERPTDGVADVIVFARGLLKHLVTRCYFPGASDDLFDEALAAHEEAVGTLRFDIHLQGERQTVFFAV